MKNKDGVEVKNGQIWMSLDKSRPRRVCAVFSAITMAAMKNIDTGVISYVSVNKMHNHSKGWKLIGTAL